MTEANAWTSLKEGWIVEEGRIRALTDERIRQSGHAQGAVTLSDDSAAMRHVAQRAIDGSHPHVKALYDIRSGYPEEFTELAKALKAQSLPIDFIDAYYTVREDRMYVVHGSVTSEPGSTFCESGSEAPFVVLDVIKQSFLQPAFPSRDLARSAADRLERAFIGSYNNVANSADPEMEALLASVRAEAALLHEEISLNLAEDDTLPFMM